MLISVNWSFIVIGHYHLFKHKNVSKYYREGTGNPLSVLAWRIPATEEPGGLPSMGSHGVRHDWSDLAAAAANTICINIYICISVEENNGYFIFLYSLYFPKFSWHKIYFSTDCFISKYPLIVINMDKFHINLIMFIKVLDSFLLVLCHIQVSNELSL